jgi:G6PDH family F420-dependent oxidoreductase
MEFGYTLMCEQAGPAQLVRDAVAAERAGFDFAVISDHYFPWLTEQGHAPFAWSVLGAVAQATERLPLMTFVTCPIRRYHPALVAQMSATMALLAPGRFTLGLGAGENLNEHVIGGEWPAVDLRHDMLEEAAGIIRALWSGEEITWRGLHFDAVNAKLFDVPETPPPLGIAVSGPSSCRIAGEHADVMIAVEPSEALGEAFDAASQFVRPEDVADAMPCGSDVEAVVKALHPWADSEFTHVALLQIGGGV